MAPLYQQQAHRRLPPGLIDQQRARFCHPHQWDAGEPGGGLGTCTIGAGDRRRVGRGSKKAHVPLKKFINEE